MVNDDDDGQSTADTVIIGENTDEEVRLNEDTSDEIDNVIGADEDVHPQKNIIQSQEHQQNIDIIDCDRPKKTEIAPSQKNATADNVSITPPPPSSKTDNKSDKKSNEMKRKRNLSIEEKNARIAKMKKKLAKLESP